MFDLLLRAQEGKCDVCCELKQKVTKLSQQAKHAQLTFQQHRANPGYVFYYLAPIFPYIMILIIKGISYLVSGYKLMDYNSSFSKWLYNLEYRVLNETIVINIIWRPLLQYSKSN